MNSILKKINSADNKGKYLEQIIVVALGDLGFTNIRQQLSGSQYGFDIYAERIDGMDGDVRVWNFECKNYKNYLSVRDIAPNLIWHINGSQIHHYAIVSTSEPSNDLLRLLEIHNFPMSIELWTGNALERILMKSPKVLKMLGMSESYNNSLKLNEIRYFPPKSPVLLNMTHELNPPYSFNYIKVGDNTMKAYSDFEFRLSATFYNSREVPADITNIKINTVNYSKVTGRILVQHKTKGFFRPPEFKFKPSTNVYGEFNIATNQILRVEKGKPENIRLILDETATPGLYHFYLSADVKIYKEDYNLVSGIFCLYILDKEMDDYVTLNVLGKHYDHLSEKILSIKNESWNFLKDETNQHKQMVFLGPTYLDPLYKDLTWKIKKIIASKEANNELIFEDQVPVELIDLGLPVDNEIYSPLHMLNNLEESKLKNLLQNLKDQIF